MSLERRDMKMEVGPDEKSTRKHEKVVHALGQLSMLNQLKKAGLLREEEYEKVRKMIMQEIRNVR